MLTEYGMRKVESEKTNKATVGFWIAFTIIYACIWYIQVHGVIEGLQFIKWVVSH